MALLSALPLIPLRKNGFTLVFETVFKLNDPFSGSGAGLIMEFQV